MSNNSPERWLPVVGYEDAYEVSSHGRVRSIDRVVPDRGGSRKLRGRTLKAATNGVYPQVTLSRNSQLKLGRIHRLVAEAFLAGQRMEGYEVCHNDGDPTNNHVENLRWDSRSGNFRDKRVHGTDHIGSRTHCIHGHEFTPENTQVDINSRGWRRRTCKQCVRDRWQRIRSAREALGEVVEVRPWKRSA